MHNRLFQKHIDLSALELTILSAPGCHLCEKAIEAVEQLRRRHPFPCTVVKLTRRHELFEVYREKIPVGLVRNQVVFTYHVEPAQLLSTLQTLAEGPP